MAKCKRCGQAISFSPDDVCQVCKHVLLWHIKRIRGNHNLKTTTATLRKLNAYQNPLEAARITMARLGRAEDEEVLYAR